MCERFLIKLIQLRIHFSLDTGELNTDGTQVTESIHFLHCPLRDLCEVKTKINSSLVDFLPDNLQL